MHFIHLDKYVFLQRLLASRRIESSAGCSLRVNTFCLLIAAVKLSGEDEHISLKEAPGRLY